MHLLWVDGGSGRRFRDDRGGHGLRDRCHSRLRQGWPNSSAFGTRRWLRLNPTRDHLLGLRRPAKFRSLCGDYLLGYFAVRLPSQGGCNTDTNRDEIAGEASSRASLFHLVFDCQETIISCLSFRSPVVEAMKDPQKNFIKLHGLPLIACTFTIFEKGTRPFVRHFRHDYPPLISHAHRARHYDDSWVISPHRGGTAQLSTAASCLPRLEKLIVSADVAFGSADIRSKRN